ncbi:MAG: DUF4149 domain-containing protein [Anaerolineales bacterium]
MTISTIINFLHLLATSTWIGGMLYINIVLMPSVSAIDPAQRGQFLGATTKRFAFLASGSIVVLVITGIMRTPSQLMFNLSTIYGIALTLKHLVISVMIVIGLVISFWLGPKVKSLTPAPGEQPQAGFLKIQSQISTFARINMVLGVLVLFLAGILI